MKKFILKILLFLILAVIADMGYGVLCKWLTSHAKGGTTYHYYYIAKGTDEDVILMGSSRMCRHYNPSVFEDSLGLTAFNTGVKGNGIILNYGMLNLILERYKPQLIVYDVYSFDMYDDDRFADDNVRYLDNLKDYYDDPVIKEIFMRVNPEEQLKMFSSLYRYNSKLPRLVGDYFHPFQNYNKGYNPYHGAMEYEPDMKDRTEQLRVDTLKLYYVEQLIKLVQASGIDLVFCSSPRYGTSSDDTYNNPIKQLCAKYDVPFLDFYSDERFVSEKHYFHDSNHLNDEGADTYTKIFVSELKKLMAEKHSNMN